MDCPRPDPRPNPRPPRPDPRSDRTWVNACREAEADQEIRIYKGRKKHGT